MLKDGEVVASGKTDGPKSRGDGVVSFQVRDLDRIVGTGPHCLMITVPDGTSQRFDGCYADHIGVSEATFFAIE